MPDDTRRTIAVTARGRRRRLRVTYPGQATQRAYDTARARELLASTTELPATRNGLIAVLTEYRRALADLAAERA